MKRGAVAAAAAPFALPRWTWGSSVEEGEEPKERTVRLTSEQVALVLRACLRYRRSLPVYLEASRPEVEAVDSLIAMLR
jgi:hypothetical protein